MAGLTGKGEITMAKQLKSFSAEDIFGKVRGAEELMKEIDGDGETQRLFYESQFTFLSSSQILQPSFRKRRNTYIAAKSHTAAG